MERLTKIEISWIIAALEAQTAILHMGADDSQNREVEAFMRLRAEQYSSITSRLKNALEKDNRRIEITH